MKKEKKSSSRLAINVAEIALTTKDDWNAFIFFAESDIEDEPRELESLVNAINTCTRPRFHSIGRDAIMAMIKENKGSDLSQACKAAMEDGAELTPDLMARLLKLKLIQLKNEAVESRAPPKPETTTPGLEGSVGAGGSTLDLSKKRKDKEDEKKKEKDKDKKRPPTGGDDEPASADKGDKKKKAKKGAAKLTEGVKLIEDEPRDGPLHYYFVHGVCSAGLLRESVDIGIPIDAIVRLNHSDAALSALQFESGSPTPNPFWPEFEQAVAASPVESGLRDIVILPASAPIQDPSVPVAKRDGMSLFDAASVAVYGLVDKRAQHRDYVNSMVLLDVPDSKGPIDTRLYRRLINRVPENGASVAFVLDCLVEQVAYTQDECGGQRAPSRASRAQSRPGSRASSRAQSPDAAMDAYVEALVVEAANELPALREQYPSEEGSGGLAVLRHGDAASARLVGLDEETALLVERAERRMLAASYAAAVVNGWVSELGHARASSSDLARGVRQQEFAHICREGQVDDHEDGFVQLGAEALLAGIPGLSDVVAQEDRRVTEAFDAFSLLQVVHEATLTRPCVATRYDDRADRLFVALHGGFWESRDRTASENVQVGVNCPVGFRNYLNHVHGTPFAAPGSHGYLLGDSVVRLNLATTRIYPADGCLLSTMRQSSADGKVCVRTSVWGPNGLVLSTAPSASARPHKRVATATFADGVCLAVAADGGLYFCTTEGVVVDVSSRPDAVSQTLTNALELSSAANETERIVSCDGSVERRFSDGSSETFSAFGAVTRRTSDGLTYVTHPDGTQEEHNAEGEMVQSRALGVTEATDPHTGDRLVTREDGVAMFSFADGRAVCEFADGTRITRLPSGHVRAECRGFAAVEFDPPGDEEEENAESSRPPSRTVRGVAWEDGGVETAPQEDPAPAPEGAEPPQSNGEGAEGEVRVETKSPSPPPVVEERRRPPRGRTVRACDGTVVTLSADRSMCVMRADGFVLTYDGEDTVRFAPHGTPNTDAAAGALADDEPGTYTLSFASGSLSTLDAAGFRFEVDACGACTMHKPFGPGSPTSDGGGVADIEGSSTALVVAGSDPLLGLVTGDANAPRVFCICPDGRAMELLRDYDLDECIAALSGLPGVSVTCDGGEEHDGHDAVTIVRHVPPSGAPGSAASSKSADDPAYYFEPLVVPRGLRTYMLRDFVRWDGMPSPRAIALRSVRRRPGMDAERREALLARISRHKAWRAEQEEKAQALLIRDERDAADRAEADEISRQIEEDARNKRAAEEAARVGCLSGAVDARVPTPPSQPKGDSTKKNGARARTLGGRTQPQKGASMRGKAPLEKSVRTEVMPAALNQLWIDGSTAPPSDVPDLFAMSAALPPLNGELPTDEPPCEGGRPTTPTPGALQNRTALPKIPSIPPTPAAAGEPVPPPFSRGSSYRDQRKQTTTFAEGVTEMRLSESVTEARLSESLGSSARSRPRSMDVDVTGRPRQTAVKVPLAVSMTKEGATVNEKYANAERRKVATSSVAVALGVPRGFELFPSVLDMGHVRAGARRNFTILLHNVGVDTARFRVAPHRDPSLISVTYKSGPVAAGMSVKLNVQIDVPQQAGPLMEEFTVETEHEIFSVEIRGVVSMQKGHVVPAEPASEASPSLER